MCTHDARYSLRRAAVEAEAELHGRKGVEKLVGDHHGRAALRRAALARHALGGA